MSQNKRIQGFDTATARAFTKALHSAMDELAEQYGLTAKCGRFSFQPDEGRITVTFSCKEAVNAQGHDYDPRKEEFERNAPLAGVDPAAYGREIQSQGRTFRVAGINLRAPKRPVELEDATGQRFKTTPAHLRAVLAAAGPSDEASQGRASTAA